MRRAAAAQSRVEPGRVDDCTPLCGFRQNNVRQRAVDRVAEGLGGMYKRAATDELQGGEGAGAEFAGVGGAVVESHLSVRPKRRGVFPTPLTPNLTTGVGWDMIC
jgi:hypothetical protein